MRVTQPKFLRPKIVIFETGGCFMSRISKLFVTAVAALMLTSCSTVSPGGGDGSGGGGGSNKNLELLSFKKVDKTTRQLIFYQLTFLIIH